MRAGYTYVRSSDFCSKASELSVADEEAEALRAAVERLPGDYRQVIELRYYRQLAFEQIGDEMGRSPEAARKLWVRAMDCLRQEWGSVR
jgi:RNA polymerase sigma-70 factor, ECF subfamily